MKEEEIMAKKQQIRERLDYIMENKEVLALYPRLEGQFIKEQVAAVRDYLSNTACVNPPLDYVLREFIKIDLFAAVDDLCKKVVNPHCARESPRPIRDALFCLSRYKAPVPWYPFEDSRWRGKDGKDKTRSKDKIATLWQQQRKREGLILEPKVIRLEAPKPQPSNPAYGERIRRQDIENADKYEKDKEEARKLIAEEMKRRKEDYVKHQA
jgi:hypothetical protein